ncbi:MAG: DUF4198 domain-containing protein [Minwuia sp.]|uniref:DUF4198 domain-containing protein n=1 Tax=Minwuia sp. TaxID=2493630 RepID=UPI003A8C29C7
MLKLLKPLAAALAAAAVASSATAHEFWLEPSKSRATVDEEIPVTIAVGQHFVGNTLPWIPQRAVRFDVYGPGGKMEEAGAAFAADPAGIVRPAGRPGLYIVAYQNVGDRITIDAPTFNKYLEEEGLDHILRHRQENGLMDQPGQEFYTRFPKTWVLAGDNVNAGRWAAAPSKLTFEMVPVSNPFELRAGDTLTLDVLYEGRPLSGIQVNTFVKGAGERIQAVRSDANGRATVTIDRAGRWLFAAVHAIPAEKKPGVDWDWESFWTSLTLDVPPPQ